MDLEKQIDGQVAVLRCAGRLNMVAAPRLRSAIDQSVEEGLPRVVVDLTETTFVDSSGLGALVGGLKAVRQAGGDLRLAGASDQVMAVLKLTNLDRVLRTHDSVGDASRDW